MKLIPDPNSRIKAEFNFDKLDGWILFDLEKGNIMKSFATANFNFTMSQMGQTILTKVTMKVNYQVL
jgi:hypothetical protein